MTSPAYDLGGNTLYVDDIKVGATRPGQPSTSQSVSQLLKVGSAGSVAAGSTKTLTAADAGKIILLDTLAGSTVTLPAATGTGNTYRFLVSVLATSVSHIVKVANGTDVFRGQVIFADTDGTAAVNAFMAASTSDTITLNRTTTGSVTVGEWIDVTDYASGFFHVTGFLSNTGTPTTPFSATVS